MSVWMGLIALGCLPWFIGPVVNRIMARRIPRLCDLDPPDPEAWPRVSVVVPACNEADTIEPALASLRSQTYPNLELILVDDRSTDETGGIIDRIAAEDPRVQAVHVRDLPDGWLGKINALKQGLEIASGEWILFSDADVELSPDVLRKTVASSIEDGIDHLCVIPQLGSASPIADLIVTAALRSIAVSQRPWRAEDPNAKESLGSGAFNLFRKSAFDRTPGLDWLKMEVADDLALGALLKQHGARPRVVTAPGDIQVEWYRSVRGAVVGLEKNAFAQLARFSVLRGFGISLIALFAALAPFMALATAHPLLVGLGAGAIVANASSAWVLQRWAGVSAWSVVFSLPIGDLLLAVTVLRGTLLGWKRGGVMWRGTLYPTAQLKEGVRIAF